MNFRSIITPVLSLLFLCTVSCKNSDDQKQDKSMEKATVEHEVAPRDSALYKMGQRHAAYMLSGSTHNDTICAKLLDIRARETDIRNRVDNDAADAYILGFQHFIIKENPELADSIF